MMVVVKGIMSVVQVEMLTDYYRRTGELNIEKKNN